jgi:hypothetical protein
MTTKIPQRDWEAISAYIDNQLKPRERSRIEARLRTDPKLQAALDELTRTRAMLRQLPQVRVPRNFTLTPEMVGSKPFSLRMFPTFRFASAIATILLVLVVAADLFSGNILTPQINEVVAPQFFAGEVVEATEAALPEPFQAPAEGEQGLQAESAQPIEQEGEFRTADAVAEEEGAAIGNEGAEVAVEEPPSESLEEPALSVAKGVEEPTETPGFTTNADEQDLTEEAVAPPEVGESVLEPSPTEATPIPTATLEPTAVPAPVATAPLEIDDPPITPVRVVELALAIFALLTGVVAFFLRRFS